MSSASIIITQDGVVGTAGISRDDLVLSEIVTLTNSNNSGIRSWRWRMKDRPTGSTASLSNTTASSCTFTPDVAGSYLVQLTVDEGRAGQVDTRIAAVRETINGEEVRWLAAGEDTEANWGGNTRGWLPDLELLIQALSGGGAPAAHAASHLPGGADALTTATAVEITDSTNAEGAGATFARAAHQHAHGNRGGGSLHALATSNTAGFMSTTYASRLDYIGSTVLYEVNYALLADNTLVDGAETVDGLAYTAFNMAELGTAAVQLGTGIRMVAATNNGGAVTMTSASQLIPYISVPLSQIAGYDPTAEYIIEIYCPARVLEANGEYVALGLYGAAASPFAGSTARMRAAKLVRNASDTADVMRVTLNATDNTGDVDISTHNVIAIKIDGAGIGQAFSGIWSSDWPTSYTPHSTFPTGALADSPLNTGGVAIFMGLGCVNDASPTTSVTIERLRIRRAI